MRRKTGPFCMALGILLMIAALGFLIYNRWDNQRAEESATEIQEALEEAVEARNTDAPAVQDENENEDEENSNNGEMDTIEIDGYEYIGTLSVPSFGLELPVMSEWSYPGLKIAPGRYSGSVWTDDLIICGHNYSRHFGQLKYLETGDEITFTDVNGNVFAYSVEEVTVLFPTDVDKMVSQESGDWDLTLFTCTIGGRTRVTVRCIRTEE